MSRATGSPPAGRAAARPVPPAPSARLLRRRLRRARRQHGEGRAGDIYLAFMMIVILGATIPQFLARHLTHTSQVPAAAATRWWLMIALAVAVLGLAWQALRALGPLLAMPDAQAWCVASPVDRGGWLTRPLGYLLAGAALAGGCLGALGALLAGHGAAGTVGGTALALAGTGVALAGFAAAVQTRRRHPAEWVPAVLGLAGAAAFVGLRYADLVPDAPSPPVGWPALAGLLVAVAAAVVAARRLGRVDRAALSAGAPLAGAAATAAIFMDSALLTGVLDARRWRRAVRVRGAGRRLRPGPRWAVLLRAELRRLSRRPEALAIWAGLLLIPYVLVLVAPEVAGVGRVVAGYFAANRLAEGLRTVSHSAALRRTLGGTDRLLRLVHLVVPAIGVLLWWLAGSGVAAPRPDQLILVAGLVFAAYRNATASPLEYGGGVVDTPFGLIPGDLLRQLLRGLDVVAVLALVQLLLPS